MLDAFGFDVAQVCPNGHIGATSVQMKPADFHEFCTKCGEKMLGSCRHCNKPLRGDRWDDESYSGWEIAESFTRPSYCQYCGKPLEWTERALDAALQVAVESDSLEEAELMALRESLTAVSNESPETAPAVMRVKKVLRKIGEEGSALIRSALAAVLNETIKRQIWP